MIEIKNFAVTKLNKFRLQMVIFSKNNNIHKYQTFRIFNRCNWDSIAARWCCKLSTLLSLICFNSICNCLFSSSRWLIIFWSSFCGSLRMRLFTVLLMDMASKFLVWSLIDENEITSNANKEMFEFSCPLK